MRKNVDTNTALTLLQGRVACKLAEINQMMVPGLAEPCSAEELQARAMRHMNALPPAEQERLRLKAMVAFAELERLTAEMTEQLDLLTDEMHKVSRHRRANLAYQSVSGPTGFGQARL